MIDNGRRLVVRYPLPLPVGVYLGAPVRMSTPFGVVDGIVVGVYRAEEDEWQPRGVLVEAMPL